MADDASVQVVVRMRPLNERELKGNTLPVVTASTEKKEIVVIKGSGNRQQRTTYNFDNVLGTQSSQEDVFEQTIQPVIADVLGGFECTMFAYGQTGTGKTHTMEGDLANPENQGVIPRAAQAIFDLLSDPKFRDSDVTASYLEIYNEELSDLLIDDSKEVKLQICEDNKPRGKGLFVQNLSETSVKTPADVLGLMQRAQLRRQVGETKMNKQSSRSHCLFTLKVHSKKVVSADGSVMECTGKLHLVDLAGSECAKTAGTEKVDLAKERERKNINQSLLTLGRVISALRDGPQGRIPYRDSKLTRLLQESLGGRCKTVIIATVSPSVLAVDETISTLNYAQAAHGIQNKPVATSYLKLGDGKKMPDGAIGVTGAGLNVQDWNQMECRLQYMQAELEEAQAALSRKHMQQQVIIDRAEAAERDRDSLTEQLVGTKDELEQACCRNGALLEHVKLTRQDLARVGRLVKARKETEDSLTAEASEVLAALSKCVTDGENLHQHLVLQAEAEAERRAKSRAFHSSAEGMLKSLGAELHKYAAEVTLHLKSVVEESKAVETSSNTHLDAVMQAVCDMQAAALDYSGKARDVIAEGVATTSAQLEGIKQASGANGQEMASMVLACEAAVKTRMASLQQQVAMSEEALTKWSAAASTKLQDTSAQLSEMLEQHRAAAEADRISSEAHLNETAGILSEQMTNLDAMASDLTSQRALQQDMSEALTKMANECVATSSFHVEVARSHAQALVAALEAQQQGQLDASLVETLEKARVMASENAKDLDELAAAQKHSLAVALQQQIVGTLNEVHGASVEKMRAEVEASCGDHCSQLAAQRAQLEKARDELHDGNAKMLHNAAIEELRSTIAEKMDVERQMLTMQKNGLTNATDDLEGQKEDEYKMIETLETESKHLREIVKVQKAALEQQAQMLETQRQELAAALEAQKQGQQKMVEVVKEGLVKMVQAEIEMRAEEEQANKARLKEEADRLKMMLAAENKIREGVEAAARERQAAAIASLEQMLLEQVGQIESTMQHDVSSLVGINGQITGENTSAQAKADAVDAAMLHLEEQASQQVRVWGEAVAAVKANVCEMSEVNTNLAAEVEVVAKTVVDTSSALTAQTDAWGKSNDVVEQALIQGIADNLKTCADVEAMQASVDQYAKVLQDETEQWRASNFDVVDKIKSIVVENEGLATAVASGAAAVDEVDVDAIQQVKAWGDSDRTCQASMQTTIDDTITLADTIVTHHDALKEQQASSFQQLTDLTNMLEGSRATTDKHASSNGAAHHKVKDLTSHVQTACVDAASRIAAVEQGHTTAISDVTTSITDMMAPHPDFLASVSKEGQELLQDMGSAVEKTSQLVAAQASSVEGARAAAVQACEANMQSHVEVLASLEKAADSEHDKAAGSTQHAKTAMAVGPASATSEADALARELASLKAVHGDGSTQLGACVKDYCTGVAKMEEDVPPAPALGTFNTAVTFSSTAADKDILSHFTPVVDMSDISSPSKQLAPKVSAAMVPALENADSNELPVFQINVDAVAELLAEPEAPRPQTAPTDDENAAEEDEMEAGEDEVTLTARPQTAPGGEKMEKKRARMATPKKSAGRQSVATERPAAKVAATAGSSRLPAPKPRSSLKELNH